MAPLLSENENVVINEFELNPDGDDNCTCTEEWVELYNPTSVDISIGGWTVTTSHGRSVTIPEGKVIAAQGFYVLSHYGNGSNGSEWLVNENESIILTDAYGTEIDSTPVESDTYDDDRTWSRVPDGYGEWVFQTSTQGSFNVNQLPKADFTFYPSNPTPGVNVQFNDSSQDVGGWIAEWFWKFGDGQTSRLQNPNHTYANARSYIVWLNVTDNDGATDRKWKILVVTENATQIEKNATQLEMVLPTSIVKVGQSFDITAILKDELGNPLEGEKVDFYVDEEKIASNVTTNSEGVASFTYTPIKSGLVLVKASYNGSSQYTGSSKEAFLTIQEKNRDWTPYILGGATMGGVVVLGSIIFIIKYRMKKKSPESEQHIQATDEEN